LTDHATYARWAEFYATVRGWKIIPIHVLVNGACSCGRGTDCSGPGKHPVHTAWQNPLTAVTTTARARSTWGDPSRTLYSVGLLCGEPSRVVVIDVDPRNGGMNSLDELERVLPGGLPATLTSETGGGGRHLFYTLPEGVNVKKGPLHKDFPGIDVQGNGSQVVLPPSRHKSGLRYAWADGRVGNEAVEACPEPMLELLLRRSGGANGAGGAGTPLDVDSLLKDKVPEGQRDNTLLRVATRYARTLGVGTDEQRAMVVAAVETFNDRACVPPLAREDVSRIARQAVNFVEGNPSAYDVPEAAREWLKERGTAANSLLSVTEGQADKTAEKGAGRAVEEAVEKAAAAAVAGGASRAVETDEAREGRETVAYDWRTTDGDLPRFRLPSDLGNRRRFVDYYGDDFRYTPGIGWLCWAGTHWSTDAAEQNASRAADNIPARIIEEALEARAGGEDDLAEKLLKWSRDCQSSGRLNQSYLNAVKYPPILVPSVDEWNRSKDTIAVANGVVDLRTGTIRPATRDDLITQALNLPYKPGFRDLTWERYLDDATGGDKEYQHYLQRAAGLTLLDSGFEEVFFLAQGASGTGKSTFVEALSAMLGTYAFALPHGILDVDARRDLKGHEVAKMFGKRIVTAAEPRKGSTWNTALLKTLSGQDALQGDEKYKAAITFMPQFTLWVTANFRPSTDDDDAIWRRMRLLPFTHVPPSPNTQMKPYLRGALGDDRGQVAILAWAVEGAVEYLKSGLSRCDVVDLATLEYRESEDRIGAFIRDCCMVDPAAATPVRDIFRRFKTWAEEGSEAAVGMDVRSLGQILQTRGHTLRGGAVQGLVLKQRSLSELAAGL